MQFSTNGSVAPLMRHNLQDVLLLRMRFHSFKAIIFEFTHQALR
jgi:hypothetical protein